jgi:prepilin-type N-terminal cleavage/methylation domain-containing protein/prepilin-type processing-associated H-X9-DG protein
LTERAKPSQTIRNSAIIWSGMSKFCRLIRSKAFSLIELLVVIAVISILSAIIFPVLARVRESARASACRSNLRQIGQAFSAYLADYDDTFPADEADPLLWMGRRWRWPLQRYLAMSGRKASPSDPLVSVDGTPGILFCPSDETAREKWDSTSYAYSAAFYHAPEVVNQMKDPRDLWDPARAPNFPVEAQSLADVKHPSAKALCGEWLSNHVDPRDASWWDSERRGAHNYLFVDGHARMVKASKIRPGANGLPDVNVTIDGVSGRDID